MLSPPVNKSPSLRSLSDSDVNMDASDNDDSEQRHEETIKRFSILSGIEDELNKKLEQKEQKPSLGTNEVIFEEDEEQSIRKSRMSDVQNEDNNRKTVPLVYEQDKQVHKHLKAPDSKPKLQPSPSYVAQTQPKSNWKQTPLADVPPTKAGPHMYKVTKHINLLEAPEPVQVTRNFSKKLPSNMGYQQFGLFSKACETERRRNFNEQFHH